ncbi:MAG TPA: hypothetical protein VFE22_03970 [Edaphobacter sp.]|nr:hypothetical protein [Edaphobacter sp.]
METLLHYWWLPMCPAAGISLLPPWLQVTTVAAALVTIVLAVRYGQKKAPEKKAGTPVIIDAEVVEA